MAGFTEGEGCFYVVVTPSPDSKNGFTISLAFQVTQNLRDLDLMQKLINFFGCGRIRLRPSGEAVDFLVTKIKDLNDKVIPFFEKIPLQGLKSKNFADFNKAADILKIKGHLTNEGLEKIRQINDGMNSRRI